MSRGSPEPNAVTHYQHPSYTKNEPFCRNGSWHLKITGNRKYVTCKVCKLKLEEKPK